MKRKRLIVAGTIAVGFCLVVLAVFRPWQTPMSDKKSIDALFAEAHSALYAYYSTNKTYPDSITALKLHSPLAPYLRYLRTGTSSCKMMYFSLGGFQISSSTTVL
jgi:hypothetical protein